ncbi:MAG: ferredoxin--NADP reductase [Burkholderiales bacterium]|nr:ferredoxin--NADP reductase [Burkholderiales bacterium]
MTAAYDDPSPPSAVAFEEVPAPDTPPRKSSAALFDATVLAVHHWTDRLFSFTTTRESSFRFQSGQFTMIGLPVDGRPLLRAYSMASSEYEPTLEFLSIKVQDGPLTSRLQHIRPGDTVLVGRKASGTLLLQNLLPGRTLYLLSSGTGLAPFMGIVRSPEVYEQFEKVVLVHGCRLVSELAYDHLIRHELPEQHLLAELISKQLVYYPTVTREPFQHEGRIPALLETGRLCSDIGLPRIDLDRDRFMLCGSPAMLADTRAVLEKRGFGEGNMSRRGHYVIERAFVDR